MVNIDAGIKYRDSDSRSIQRTTARFRAAVPNLIRTSRTRKVTHWPDFAVQGHVRDVAAIREILAAKVPTFGICLGHQLLGLAAGARTLKMKFGHHGANHPVIDLDSGRVMISSQNHGFAVDESSLPANVRVTHRSLFDQSNQGIALNDTPAFSFQGHPEASPGPHDVAGLFDRFIAAMQAARDQIQPRKSA